MCTCSESISNPLRCFRLCLNNILMHDLLHNPFLWLQTHVTAWVVLGLAGQFLFMMRFVYQWIASERAKKSVMPEAFWYFSLGGGLIVFIYALHLGDIVFILGQGLGVFIYLRNIYFIWRHRLAAAGK
jgi:lipid-A-disaccharide synthase-like uncharacterized protein